MNMHEVDVLPTLGKVVSLGRLQEILQLSSSMDLVQPVSYLWNFFICEVRHEE
jgi:hypothetical protein